MLIKETLTLKGGDGLVAARHLGGFCGTLAPRMAERFIWLFL